MSVKQSLARDAGLLEFAIRNGKVKVGQSFHVDGELRERSYLSRGQWFAADARQIGFVRFGPTGFVLVSNGARPVVAVDRLGRSGTSVVLEHPAHAAVGWAERLRQLGVEGSGAAHAAVAPTAKREPSTHASTAAASRPGAERAVVERRGGDGSDSYELASVGKRALGAIIDSFSVFGAVTPGYALLLASAPESGEPDGLMAVLGGLLVLVGVGIWIAVSVGLAQKRSQSIGKYFVNTQVYHLQSGRRADFGTQIVRGLLYFVVSLFFACIPCVGGTLVFLVNGAFISGRSDRRAPHDLLAGTTVVDFQA